MFPYLDFAVVVFVLLAGFVLGLLLGFLIRRSRVRASFDGDGGEPIPVRTLAGADSDRSELAQVIPFPTRRAG